MTDDDDVESDAPEYPNGPPSPNPDAASRKGTKRQREALQKHQDLVAAFWQQVLADPVGRAEVWRILSSGGAFRAPFACGPNGFPQPEATWFKAGQQALVLGEYHRLMRYDLAGVRQMLSESDWKDSN